MGATQAYFLHIVHPVSRCRRPLAVDRSSSSWLCCQPCLAKASPRPHTSAASHSACAAACPARSSSYCHPPPDPCRTLGQPLCARCGGDPLDLFAFELLPGAAYDAPNRVAAAVPMCGWAVATALGHSHTVGVGESGHVLGNGSYNSLAEQRALCAAAPLPRRRRAPRRLERNQNKCSKPVSMGVRRECVVTCCCSWRVVASAAPASATSRCVASSAVAACAARQAQMEGSGTVKQAPRWGSLDMG